MTYSTTLLNSSYKNFQEKNYMEDLKKNSSMSWVYSSHGYCNILRKIIQLNLWKISIYILLTVKCINFLMLLIIRINVSLKCPFLLQFVHVSHKISQTTQITSKTVIFMTKNHYKNRVIGIFYADPTMLNFHIL